MVGGFRYGSWGNARHPHLTPRSPLCTSSRGLGSPMGDRLWRAAITIITTSTRQFTISIDTSSDFGWVVMAAPCQCSLAALRPFDCALLTMARRRRVCFLTSLGGMPDTEQAPTVRCPVSLPNHTHLPWPPISRRLPSFHSPLSHSLAPPPLPVALPKAAQQSGLTSLDPSHTPTVKGFSYALVLASAHRNGRGRYVPLSLISSWSGYVSSDAVST